MCVDFSVALEQLIQGSEQPLETVAIEGETNAVGLQTLKDGRYFREDTGRTGRVLEEGELSEIRALLVVHDLGRGLAGLEDLHGVGFAPLKEEEDVAFVALLAEEVGHLVDDFSAGLVLDGLDGVHDLHQLVRLDGGEDLDALQELLVGVALLAAARETTYIAASFTMLVKVGRSRLQSTASVLAVMVAARGALYKSASSPKASPGWYSLSSLGGWSLAWPVRPGLTNCRWQVRVPVSTT